MFGPYLSCTAFLLPAGVDYAALASYWSGGAEIERTNTGALHWHEKMSLEFAEDEWRHELPPPLLVASRSAIVPCSDALKSLGAFVFVSSFPAVSAAFKARLSRGVPRLGLPGRESRQPGFEADLNSLFLSCIAEPRVLGPDVSLHTVEMRLGSGARVTFTTRSIKAAARVEPLREVAGLLRLRSSERAASVASMDFDIQGGHVSVASDFDMTIGDVASDIDEIVGRVTRTCEVVRDWLKIHGWAEVDANLH